MTALQVLAACGIVSGIVGTVGGLLSEFSLIGIASGIMLSGNVYTLINKDTEEHGND